MQDRADALDQATCGGASGNVWDDSATESLFSSLRTERTAALVYRTRDAARADVFDRIERFYNPKRRHSTLGLPQPHGVRSPRHV